MHRSSVPSDYIGPNVIGQRKNGLPGRFRLELTVLGKVDVAFVFDRLGLMGQ